MRPGPGRRQRTGARLAHHPGRCRAAPATGPLAHIPALPRPDADQPCDGHLLLDRRARQPSVTGTARAVAFVSGVALASASRQILSAGSGALVGRALVDRWCAATAIVGY